MINRAIGLQVLIEPDQPLIRVRIHVPKFFKHLRRLGEVCILHTSTRVIVIQVGATDQFGFCRYGRITGFVMLSFFVLNFTVCHPVIVGCEVNVPDPILLTEDEIQQHDLRQFLHPIDHLFGRSVGTEIACDLRITRSFGQTFCDCLFERFLRSQSQKGGRLLKIKVLAFAPTRLSSAVYFRAVAMAGA